MEILNGIAFNSQPKAYWPICFVYMLRLTVSRRRTVFFAIFDDHYAYGDC